ncbi:MAG: hypothetical protein AB7D57_07435 [Desulfovibrionaceae bacterium]
MELIAQLEEKVLRLLDNIKELEQENARLREELAQARAGTEDVRTRIGALLEKIGEHLR